MAHDTEIRRNHLLASLRNDEYERLGTSLEQVSFTRGQVLCEARRGVTHVYFPTTATISLLCTMRDGSSAETGLVGREGLVGISVFMGVEVSPGRAVVESAGNGYRLKAGVAKAEFSLGATLQAVVLRYAHALIIQMAQAAVCARHHRLDQQLCRLLLLGIDRSPDGEVHQTQETIASLLGVRREAVTAAAGKLQADGLIRCGRGRIKVLDRESLELRACECYTVVRSAYLRTSPVCGAPLTLHPA